ncbi:glycosyltransferase family 4 protein [Comamonas thiooxydans]|uniref:glycosyltransferase family 4 protein n=1 Tax=Comamonas thiooxydans TaxID=363952 RepID=UPI0018A5BA0C|nr:glycosyltransferase family 4 protein [Comamonas thiooxydans]QOQ81809.1 glycosyltransferase family 4 protein [Comamonas thiooxydans]
MKIALVGTLVASVFNFRVNLINSLISQSHQVYILCVDFDEASKARLKEMGAIPVDYVLNRAGLNPFRDLIDTWKLSKLLKQIAPDVVLSYFVKPVIFGTAAAKLAGVPRRIGMLEGLGYVFTDLPSGVSKKQALLRRVQIFLYRMTLPWLSRLIFLNPDDPVDLLERYGLRAPNVSVLGGVGVNLQEYAYVPPNIEQPLSFIFVGRLLAEKGIREYVAAARVVKERHPAVRFIVLGGLDEANPGGLSRKELDDLIASGVVEYPGHVSSVGQWLAAASVFVLPSYREGVPCSTQEAMAVGRAVITADVPGCRETVVDGVNGYLVPRWNAEALAQKMLCFVREPALAARMGQESRRLAEQRFDAEKVNARLIQMLLD